MKNQWRLVLIIVLMTIISVFAVLNVESVPVSFGFTTFAAPLIIIIFVSLLLGALLTLLVSTMASVHRKKELKTLRAEISQLESQSSQLRDEIKTEYTEKITALEETISGKDNKINSLENELVNQITYNNVNIAKPTSQDPIE